MSKVLQPEYYGAFKCIGTTCEDSCCIGWRVELDKKTYNSYKKVHDNELKPIISEFVSRYHKDVMSETSYGRIRMEKDGRCPFLNKKNLCKVYINIGEKHLSNVCASYPRTTNKVNGFMEKSASTSCPEIARLVLLNPDGLRFFQLEEEEDTRPLMLHRNIDTEGHLYINKLERHFWDIRLLSLSILQNRNYSLDDRLVLLGIVYKKISELKSKKDIPKEIEKFSKAIEQGSMKEALDKIPKNTAIQMRLAKEMTDMKVVEDLKSLRYLQCVRDTLLGLAFENGKTMESILEKYDYNYREYLVPYINEKEYVLENFLVNFFFKELMPFGNYKSILDAYTFLCISYSMIKMHLIGMGGKEEGITDEMVVKLIQSYSKVVLHNRPFMARIIDVLQSSGYGSLAYLSILVKN